MSTVDAFIDLSAGAYDELAGALRAAGLDHAFRDHGATGICVLADLPGLALRCRRDTAAAGDVPGELARPLTADERRAIERFIRVLDYERSSGAEDRALGYLRRLYGALLGAEARAGEVPAR